MQFWKGQAGTPKEGQCGTKDDGAIVPDAVAATQAEYDAWVALQPVIPVPDYKALYTAAATDGQKLAVIAQKLNLV